MKEELNDIEKKILERTSFILNQLAQVDYSKLSFRKGILIKRFIHPSQFALLFDYLSIILGRILDQIDISEEEDKESKAKINLFSEEGNIKAGYHSLIHIALQQTVYLLVLSKALKKSKGVELHLEKILIHMLGQKEQNTQEIEIAIGFTKYTNFSRTEVTLQQLEKNHLKFLTKADFTLQNFSEKGRCPIRKEHQLLNLKALIDVAKKIEEEVFHEIRRIKKLPENLQKFEGNTLIHGEINVDISNKKYLR